MSKNIFVLGLDEGNLATFRNLAATSAYNFHPLLSVAELVEADELPIEDMLKKADQQLRDFDGSIDAIVGYWDFPVSSMVPILCGRFGLRSASLESVLKCEHKYWSRLEQRKVIDEHPRFDLVDLDDADPAPPPGFGYPMWLKPVKAFSSELAFRVTDDDGFREAAREINEGADRVAKPFQFVLDHAQLPAEIADIGARACLAEDAVGGQQVTVEGYNTGDEIRIYGVVDSHNYPDTASFQRYQYPSTLPESVLERLADISRRVIEQIELESTAFNIEYFWDAETDAIRLLEINPRHSQSHAILFDYVDGAPNHQCIIKLALGEDPEFPHRQGRYPTAAKWFNRRFSDGLVRRSPTEEEVATAERAVPGAAVEILAHEGDRLSELPDQDSYSYAIATVHVGADSEAELIEKYERCIAELPFEFDD